MRLAKLFRTSTKPVRVRGNWRVRFEGAEIKIPLRAETMWLDWDFALGILGHDIEVKQTYLALLHSPLRPTIFVDIGANYGAHSLLFLSCGVEVISIEPNPRCTEYFRSLCASNRLSPRISPVALAAQHSETDLYFPERDTWLGTINPVVQEQIAGVGPLTRHRVEVRTLDSYIDELQGRKVLIKLDTEGSETVILEGADRTLLECRPLIILESRPEDNRASVFDLLDAARYNILSLPWNPTAGNVALSRDAFACSAESNFIALPTE